MDFNNLNLAQSLGLLTTGAGLLEGQGLGSAVRSGLGTFSGLSQINQLEEERRRREALRLAQDRLATAAQMGGVDMAGNPVDITSLAAQANPELFSQQLVKQAFEKPERPTGKPIVLVDTQGRRVTVRQDSPALDSLLARGFSLAEKPKSGMGVRVNPETGEVEVVQGDVKFTEQQSKDIGYATRMRGTLEPLVGLDEELTSITQKVIDQDPTGLVRGQFGRPEYQVAENLGQQFLTGILRKDTGAAIQAWENSLYGRMFLPQPGDTGELIRQKRSARELAVLGIEEGLPASAIASRDQALQKAVFGKSIFSEGGDQSAASVGFSIMSDAELANMDASTLSQADQAALIEELRKRAR
jgi:hypothetical protein